MENKENFIGNYSHSVNMIERKNLMVTGVKKIENFDSEEFLLDTVLGHLVIKGESLELVKLDTMQGNVSIKGSIFSMVYIDDLKAKDRENSFISRLFK